MMTTDPVYVCVCVCVCVCVRAHTCTCVLPGLDAGPGDPERYRGSRDQEPGAAAAEEDV